MSAPAQMREPVAGHDVAHIAAHLFRAGEPPVLLGGRCQGCARTFFPQPRFCPDCLEETTRCELGSHGSLYSYAVVRTRAPFGLPQPYAVGYVDLDECGLRVFALLDPQRPEPFTIGQRLRLACGVVGEDGQGNPCVRPYFVAADLDR